MWGLVMPAAIYSWGLNAFSHIFLFLEKKKKKLLQRLFAQLQHKATDGRKPLCTHSIRYIRITLSIV